MGIAQLEECCIWGAEAASSSLATRTKGRLNKWRTTLINKCDMCGNAVKPKLAICEIDGIGIHTVLRSQVFRVRVPNLTPIIPCIPIGRESGLKIHKVWVRIPPREPIR